MRYWHPFTESAVEDIKADKINEVVVLPLYPHFSISTSGSSFRELRRLRERDKDFQKLSIKCIRSWFDNSGYISSMAELIEKEILACDAPEKAHICFTAHGVPTSYVEEAGDPYKQEIEDCSLLIIDKIENSLGYSNSYTLSYQSRVGPEEWLKPYTEDVLQSLGEEGVEELIVVPISFVSEHIETLQEIDIEYRDIAIKHGIKNFRRVKALDTYPLFINGLADLVTSCLKGSDVSLDDAAKLPDKIKLYPQEKWQWGWNISAEVWNGRVAMFVFIICLLELIIGNGPLHFLGLL